MKPPPTPDATQLPEAKTGGTAKPPTPPKFIESITKKIPTGPFYVSFTHSDTAVPITALMKKRAFQVADYIYSSLPLNCNELLETATTIPSPAAAIPAVGAKGVTAAAARKHARQAAVAAAPCLAATTQ